MVYSTGHPVLQRGISVPEGTTTPSLPVTRSLSVGISDDGQAEVFNFDLSNINNALPNGTGPPATTTAHYELMVPGKTKGFLLYLIMNAKFIFFRTIQYAC